MAKVNDIDPSYKVDVFLFARPANERKDFWPNGPR